MQSIATGLSAGKGTRTIAKKGTQYSVLTEKSIEAPWPAAGSAACAVCGRCERRVLGNANGIFGDRRSRRLCSSGLVCLVCSRFAGHTAAGRGRFSCSGHRGIGQESPTCMTAAVAPASRTQRRRVGAMLAIKQVLLSGSAPKPKHGTSLRLGFNHVP